jgi:hypothetical protein
MVNYIKAAIDLGKPVVKAVGEAFDALGNKIGALLLTPSCLKRPDQIHWQGALAGHG